MNKAIEFCGHCGSRLDKGATFCGECGQPVDNDAGLVVSQPPPQRVEKPHTSAQPTPALAVSKQIKALSPWLFVGAGVIILAVVGCVGLLAASLLFPSTPAQPPPDYQPPMQDNGVPVLVVNQSNENICEMYISPSADDRWGQNLLPAGEVIAPGESAQFSVPVTGAYDLLVADCNGETLAQEQQVQITAEGVIWTVTP